jgi:hypothetical protein
LPFTTFQSQKSTPGGSKRKGKGPPAKIILHPNIADYQILPNIMEMGCTAATQSMDVNHQGKNNLEKIDGQDY